MLIFSYLLRRNDWNNSGNYLLDENKKLWVIDNEFIFGPIDSPEYKSYFLADRAIPKEIQEKFKNFISNKNKIELLEKNLKELLDQEQINMFLKQVEEFAKFCEEGKFPSR